MTSNPLPTGVMAVDSAVIWAVAVTAIAAGIAVLVRLLRGVGKVARTMEDFAEDWHGEPGRPGVPGRSGVMERLGRIESGIEGMETRLQGVENKLGGGPRGGRAPMRAVN